MSVINDIQSRQAHTVGLASQNVAGPARIPVGQPGLAGSQVPQVDEGMMQTIKDLGAMIATGSREEAIKATQFAAEDPQMMELLKPAIMARQEAESQQVVR